MRSGPWETFSTRMTPKMSPRPRATIEYSAPASRPEMTTWPSMAGVMTNKGSGYRWFHGGVGKRGLPLARSSGHTTTRLPSCHWIITILWAIWKPSWSTA